MPADLHAGAGRGDLAALLGLRAQRGKVIRALMGRAASFAMNSAASLWPSSSVYSIAAPSCGFECRSRAAVMVTSASSEKREVLPRSRLLMRGCVRPHRLAALVCVQSLASIKALILASRLERTRRVESVN